MAHATQTSFPKDQIRFLLLEGPHRVGHESIERDGFSAETLPGSLGEGELFDAVADARVLGIRSKTQVTRAVLDAAPKLLAIGAFCIGTNQVDLDACAQRGIPVFNAPFSNTRSVAELTIAEIVTLYRRLGDRSRAMHDGRWEKSASGSHEIRGRTLGLVGYGHIGSQVSVLAEAMGLRVIFHDVAPKLSLGNARPVGSLDELLAEADVVSLHVPATSGTRGMFGEREIRAMRSGAMLLNNARGNVVDIDALARALADGHLGGAAVDVFPSEPVEREAPFESPLRNLPNVILTPHIGGSTQEAQEAIARDVSAKLIRFINDGATTGAVNVPEVDLTSQDRAADGVRPHRILNFHRNEPGFLRSLNGVMAERGVNVLGQSLQTRGELGYVVLDVAPADTDDLRGAVDALRGSVRTRVLW